MLASGAFWRFTAFRFRNLRQKTRITLFRTLFRGREDVYARRWENVDLRSGYVPVAVKDWKAINKSRPEERKRVDQKTRRFLPLTDAIIEDHLVGEETVGVYSSSTVLRAHEPDQCDQLVARHRAHVAERRAALEKRAEASLTEIPERCLQAPWHHGVLHEAVREARQTLGLPK